MTHDLVITLDAADIARILQAVAVPATLDLGTPFTDDDIVVDTSKMPSEATIRISPGKGKKQVGNVEIAAIDHDIF